MIDACSQTSGDIPGSVSQHTAHALFAHHPTVLGYDLPRDQHRLDARWRDIGLLESGIVYCCLWVKEHQIGPGTLGDTPHVPQTDPFGRIGGHAAHSLLERKESQIAAVTSQYPGKGAKGGRVVRALLTEQGVARKRAERMDQHCLQGFFILLIAGHPTDQDARSTLA